MNAEDFVLSALSRLSPRLLRFKTLTRPCQNHKPLTAENAERPAEFAEKPVLESSCLGRSHHQNPTRRSRPRFKRPLCDGFTPGAFHFPGETAHFISVDARHTQTWILKTVIHPTINAMHKNLRVKKCRRVQRRVTCARRTPVCTDIRSIGAIPREEKLIVSMWRIKIYDESSPSALCNWHFAVLSSCGILRWLAC